MPAARARAQLMDALVRVTDEVNRYGVELRAGQSERISQLKPEEALKAADVLLTYLDIIQTVGVDVEVPRVRYSLQLQDFLKRYKLELADKTFLDNYREGDLIEVYSLGHQQLFRNPEFFKICSYDLETLVFVPWHLLFWRHESVQSEIMQVLTRVVREKVPVWENPPVPQHILRECYEEHDREIHYHMKKVGTILDVGMKEPMGYITILEAFTMPQGSNVSIL